MNNGRATSWMGESSLFFQIGLGVFAEKWEIRSYVRVGAVF